MSNRSMSSSLSRSSSPLETVQEEVQFFQPTPVHSVSLMLLELMGHVHLETCSVAELKKIVFESVEYLEERGHLQTLQTCRGVQCSMCLLVHDTGPSTCEFCGNRIAVRKLETRTITAL
eukprot:gnl/MRDRNA2_/MRDRNA2_538326_c0_seq1.p1 gnl/MRDRNA2_/MRDRNA2_538326_c0~~gnl/MRDRNA2_/MRDRNA2_538326_c0_seq1.p1  ORF type:complete len:137 (-),score=8.67 gnl/MRDRNA2_/MRDRNA2_538326_c0_seq1:43-399(-)